MTEIRRLKETPDDLAVYKELRLEALRVNPEAYASAYDDWARLGDDGWYDRMRDVLLYASFTDGVPSGLMAVHFTERARVAHRGTIVMVYLREAARGSGAAKALLDACADGARGASMTQLELSVNAANTRAIRFYAREGFEEIGRIPNGYLHEGVYSDDVLMWRPLR